MASRQPKSESARESAKPPVGVRGYRVRNVAKAAERRREILVGAARAFAHASFDATNMDQIAHECGLAKGHIYHYFRSKEEIFTEIRVDAVGRLLDQLNAIVRSGETDPAVLLRKATASIVGRIYEERDRYEPLVPDPVSLSAANRKRIRSIGRRYEHMFTNILRMGIEKGVFIAGDAKLMSFVILRGAFTVANWYRENGKWKPQWIVEEVTEQLVRSVLKQR
ncbi:MAG TPA: TetR/AcrR family transcriptional regulator [Candidatus Binataceae bacterium]|nr:TetR/AcrR family transcriptional regulator [Candidatus Binataceae bacterium]